MMDREEISNSIPMDLVLEIFSRLPATSVARFRSLSKLWEFLLRGPYFTELFLTNSYARPRLLFAVEREGDWLFYSSSPPQNPYEKSSSLVVAAGFHMKFYGGYNNYDDSFGPVSVSGLIYIPNMRISSLEATNHTANVICNPSTGQYVLLPKIWSRSFLGFDPINKQFKVLLVGEILHDYEMDTQILTLGTGKLSWRKIKCPFIHDPYNQEICINGVLYYLATQIDTWSRVIVCFDVKSEKFRFIDIVPLSDYPIYKLVNYKGKLGCGGCTRAITDKRIALKLTMWVLQDVEKQEWSKYVLRWDYQVFGGCSVNVYGVTSAGEIVLSPDYTSIPFYVFYFNPETNTLRRVEIQVLGANLEGFNKGRIYTFVDHIEDLKFNIETESSDRHGHLLGSKYTRKKRKKQKRLERSKRTKFQSAGT